MVWLDHLTRCLSARPSCPVALFSLGPVSGLLPPSSARSFAMPVSCTVRCQALACELSSGDQHLHLLAASAFCMPSRLHGVLLYLGHHQGHRTCATTPASGQLQLSWCQVLLGNMPTFVPHGRLPFPQGPGESTIWHPRNCCCQLRHFSPISGICRASWCCFGTPEYTFGCGKARNCICTPSPR